MAKAVAELTKASLTLDVVAERWASVCSKKIHDLVERSANLFLMELAIKTDYGAVSERSSRFKSVDVSRFVDSEDKMLLRAERKEGVTQRERFTTTLEAASLIEEIVKGISDYKSHSVGSMIADIYVESEYAGLSVEGFNAKMSEFMTNLNMDADGLRGELLDYTQKLKTAGSYEKSIALGVELRDSIKKRIETMGSRFSEETEIEERIHLRGSVLMSRAA